MSVDDSSRSHSHLGQNGFPNINGKLREFISQLQKLKEQQRLPPIVPLLGTVKIHGMHADIVFDLQDRTGPELFPPRSFSSDHDETPGLDSHLSNTSNDSSMILEIPNVNSSIPSHVHFQSRNLLCAPSSSQHGWPRDIAQFPAALSYLKTRILERYTSLYPGAIIDRTQPLIIAGEWIGKGIQEQDNVGICQLSPRFVMFGVKLNGTWLSDNDWFDIEANKAGIFTVHRVPPFHVDFDTSDISETNHILLDMQRIADEVEECCPFAAHFGIPNSRGEGIVWKIGVPEGMREPKCWFKTKGPLSGPQNRIDVQSIAARMERKVEINGAVENWVSDQRMEQAFQYLLELKLMPGKEGVQQFVSWMVRDIMTEEAAEIEELRQQSTDARRVVRSKVAQLARKKYFEKMNEVERSLEQQE